MDPLTVVRDAVEAEREKLKRNPKTNTELLNEWLAKSMRHHLGVAKYWEARHDQMAENYREAVKDYFKVMNASLVKFMFYKFLLFIGVDRYEARDYLQAEQGSADAEEASESIFGRDSADGEGRIFGLLQLLRRVVRRSGSQGVGAKPKA